MTCRGSCGLLVGILIQMGIRLKVLVIGGYGEFGGRLAQLLLRDGHSVVVAGRSILKASAFCQQNGGSPLQFDINTDLASISDHHLDVVVDAAGPFQSYGDDVQRYKVACATLISGAHYLDLSDDGEFTKGISSIDSLAKEHSRFALSGTSSTPALSGAAVTAMTSESDSIEKIEATILPGGRAPKGYSVMWAILSQVGNPVPFWRANEWVSCSGWSEPVKKAVGGSIKRSANLIQTADVVLFPEHFNARTVLFRAGLSQTIMHKSVQWLGALRQKGYLPVLTRFISPLTWLANTISFIGSDYGGMLVEVVSKSQDTKDSPSPLRQYTWELLAAPGEGPFVPAIAARTILRNIEHIPAGARACINELPLIEFEHAMQDIGVETKTQQGEFHYLFQSALHQHWADLPKELRESHSVVDRKVLKGRAKITRGTSIITEFIANVFRFPKAVDSIGVQVTKTRVGDAEVWWRDFGGQRFKSTLRLVDNKANSAAAGFVEEQFGLMKFVLQLPIHDDVMHMNVVSGRCFGIPIPKLLLPVSNTTEFVSDERMHFSVELRAPLNLGLIVLYEGSLV